MNTVGDASCLVHWMGYHWSMYQLVRNVRMKTFLMLCVDWSFMLLSWTSFLSTSNSECSDESDHEGSCCAWSCQPAIYIHTILYSQGVSIKFLIRFFLLGKTSQQWVGDSKYETIIFLLQWVGDSKTKKFNHKSKTFSGAQANHRHINILDPKTPINIWRIIFCPYIIFGYNHINSKNQR